MKAHSHTVVYVHISPPHTSVSIEPMPSPPFLPYLVEFQYKVLSGFLFTFCTLDTLQDSIDSAPWLSFIPHPQIPGTACM